MDAAEGNAQYEEFLHELDLKSLVPYYWQAPLKHPSSEYNTRIAQMFVVFMAVHVVALGVSKLAGPPLSTRPTVVGTTLHGFVTSWSAMVLIALGPQYYWVWQKAILPFSFGYFVCDTLVYAIPKLDVLIAFHHLLIPLCHYPLGEDLGALVLGVGDRNFALWLSMVGYLVEFVVPVLSLRWWLTQTLSKHNSLFFACSAFIVAAFVLREGLLVYAVYRIYLRYEAYKSHHQLITLSLGVFGFTGTALLNTHWLVLMVRKGLDKFLYLQEGEKGKGFAFAASFGNSAASTKQRKSAKKD